MPHGEKLEEREEQELEERLVRVNKVFEGQAGKFCSEMSGLSDAANSKLKENWELKGKPMLAQSGTPLIEFLLP